MKPTLVALFALTASSDPGPSPAPVWHDEFAGPAGASFDHTKWVADTGGHGFGNQERQFYTTRAENVALDGDGHLVITARAEPPSSAYQCWYGRCGYTSTRLKTGRRLPTRRAPRANRPARPHRGGGGNLRGDCDPECGADRDERANGVRDCSRGRRDRRAGPGQVCRR